LLQLARALFAKENIDDRSELPSELENQPTRPGKFGFIAPKGLCGRPKNSEKDKTRY
jgi:hypothetical protein